VECPETNFQCAIINDIYLKTSTPEIKKAPEGYNLARKIIISVFFSSVPLPLM
jgi:hypothetical protein